MCQLLFVNLGDEILNKIFLSHLLQVDSIFNQDGTGFLSIDEKKGPKVWKSEMAADSISNLGLILNARIKGDYPVMAHVRAASKGIAVSAENSHPFIGERFILAHNGRLYDRDEEVSYGMDSTDTSIASDSKMFLDAMENMSKESPDKSAQNIITDCMKLFMGKFALLIYDSYEKKHYIARGRTADLHYVDLVMRRGKKISNIGYIVNTKKNSLRDGILMGASIAQVLTNNDIYYGEVVELKANTLYEARPHDLLELGEVKENTVVYKSKVFYDANKNFESNYTPDIDVKLPEISDADRIYNYASDHFLSIQDIDMMFYLILGVPMARVRSDDVSLFAKEIVSRCSIDKRVREKISNILTPEGKIALSVYEKVPGLQYPWVVNDKEHIQDMVRYLESWKKTFS